MKKITQEPIWTTEDIGEMFILKGNIVVFDETLYQELLQELRDTNKHIYTGEIAFEPKTPHVNYKSTGCIIHADEENSNRTHITFYSNPRKKVQDLMTGQEFNSAMDLLDLFTNGITLEQKLQELKNARILLDQLTKADLEPQTAKAIIKQMWPNFGFFATECLRCTKFEATESYSLEDVKEIARLSNQIGVTCSDQVTEILNKEEFADRNAKVLSLAKQAYSISNPSK